jgi:hypothetical protein
VLPIIGKLERDQVHGKNPGKIRRKSGENPEKNRGKPKKTEKNPEKNRGNIRKKPGEKPGENPLEIREKSGENT